VVEGGRLSEADVAEVLKGCIDDLKLTIDSLEPVEADLLLLLATLRFRLGPRLAGAGVSLRWEISDVPPLDWLDPRNALHILRILQEAFTNTLKHTRATQIRVMTGAEDGYVSVVIADNGGGFDVGRAIAGAARAWPTSNAAPRP
jgi:signal transduction histidine kinase